MRRVTDFATRRSFLRLAGAATLTGLVAACESSDRPSGGADPSSAPSTTTPPTTTAAPSATTAGPADFAALDRGLGGGLIRPGAASYDSTRVLFNPRFDGVRPQAIAQCANKADVAEAVRFAGRYGLPVAVRSGGHSYAGASTGPGLVIDVGPMHAVSASGGAATVGAGTRLIDLYSALSARGVGVPGGSCPSVGIGGLTLGGGIGVVDRAWGLTCDNVTGVTVVTADGQVRRCDARHDADLLWACQGGGGGTFGVVTNFTFRTHPVAPVSTWFLQWPWERAGEVLSAWFRFVPNAPDELWGSVHLSSAPNSGAPTVQAVGTFLGGGGDGGALGAQLDRLVAAVGSQPNSRSASSHAFLDTMLTEAGCSDKGFARCHLAPAGSVQRQAYTASSDWITTPMSQAGIGTLLQAVQQRHDTSGAPDVAVQLDASGGAINRVRPGATAFVHRTAICSVQYLANWYDDTPRSAVASAAVWPQNTRQAMQRYVSGQAYQNYADPSIKDFANAYFGANYRRLQQIKARYDPEDLFHHSQSVRPD